MVSDVRACPFCAEEIKAAAIVCKHCGRDVPQVLAADAWGEDPTRPVVEEATAEKARRLGVSWRDGAWRFGADSFRSIENALAHAEHQSSHPTAPAVSEARAQPGWSRWLPIGSVVLFVAAAGYWGLGFKVREVESLVRASLKDPASAQFADVHVKEPWGCGVVNAKNAMGGYVGERVFLVHMTTGGVEFMEPEESGSERLASLDRQIKFLEKVHALCAVL